MSQKHLIKAAVCRHFGEPLTVETLSLSPPSPRQVRIKMSACAICHSDITYMDGGWGGTPPIVFGHEAAGTVLEAGVDSGFDKGGRVVATLLRSCGSCWVCEQGAPSQCQSEFAEPPHLHDAAGKPVAAGLKTGAFAEQIIVDCSQVVAIPETLTFERASLLACGVLTGWGAVVNTAAVPVGASVAVVGCGGVGLNCVQAAAQAGASPIVAVDVSEEKLELAPRFGATYVTAAGDDAVDKARAFTAAGRGFDYVFMAAGSARAVEFSLQLVSPLGALVLVGMPPDGDDAKFNTTIIAHAHQRILGSKMGGARLRVDVPKLIGLYNAGHLKLDELIGERYALDAVNDAITASRQGGALRNIIVFD